MITRRLKETACTLQILKSFSFVKLQSLKRYVHVFKFEILITKTVLAIYSWNLKGATIKRKLKKSILYTSIDPKLHLQLNVLMFNVCLPYVPQSVLQSQQSVIKGFHLNFQFCCLKTSLMADGLVTVQIRMSALHNYVKLCKYYINESKCGQVQTRF